MNNEEEKKEDESDNSNFSELNIFNKIFKKSKNVENDLIDSNRKVKESQKNIKNNESFNLSKYKEYLMSKKINIEAIVNNEIEKGNDIINNNNENELKLLEDTNIYYKRKKNNKNNKK